MQRRKKRLIMAMGTAIVVVAVCCLSVLSFLNIQNSRAGFQKSESVQAEISAGVVEQTLSKLTGVDVTKAAEKFDATGVTVGDLVGNTTTGGTVLGYTVNFDNIYPGWKEAYGFEIKNTGTLNSFLDLYLGTMRISPSDSTVDWDEQDPRERIKFTVYSASELSNQMPAIATGHLQGSTVVVDTKTETDQYGNFQVPGKIPGTNNELVDSNSKIYYIVVLEFEDVDQAWQGNNAGDNIYERSKFKVNFSIGTAGHLTTGFKYEEPTTEQNP